MRTFVAALATLCLLTASGQGQTIVLNAVERVGEAGGELVATVTATPAAGGVPKVIWQLDAYGAPVQRGEFTPGVRGGLGLPKRVVLRMPPVKKDLIAPLTFSAGFAGTGNVSATLNLWVCQSAALRESAPVKHLVLHAPRADGALAEWTNIEMMANPSALPADRPWLVHGQPALLEPALRHAAQGGRAALLAAADGMLPWETLAGTAPERVVFSRSWFAPRQKHLAGVPDRLAHPIHAGAMIQIGGAEGPHPYAALEIAWSNGGALLVLGHALADTPTGHLQMRELTRWLANQTSKETP